MTDQININFDMPNKGNIKWNFLLTFYSKTWYGLIYVQVTCLRIEIFFGGGK